MAIYNGGLSIKNVSIGTATGSGNAITSLSADGNVITPDKGSTFLTAQDISSKEDKSNKVTAWSSTTNDAHYPSEKLVKSALDGKAEKSEIEASVTTNSLTAGAINPQGSANIGSPSAKFNEVYANTFVFSSIPLAQREIIQQPLYAGPSYPGKDGYIKCISVKVTYTYANAYISWRIGQRGFNGFYDIRLLLEGHANIIAGVDRFRITNTVGWKPDGVYAVVADNTTVDIYIKKIEGYDAISIINCECPNYLSGTVQISYPFTFAESVPSGAIEAWCPMYLGDYGFYGAVFN